MEWPRLPSRWDEWTITEKLGEGAYGSVYRAEREIGDQKIACAIKILELSEEEEESSELYQALGGSRDSVKSYYRDWIHGFVQEIQLMEKLKGITNIVSIQDYELVEEEMAWRIYIRMELLTDFPKYLQSHVMKEDEAIRLGTELCTALEYCEKVKIIHRDIKPDNIFVSELGSFKLGDFGVARQMDLAKTRYSSRGTYTYMAPEVYQGKRYDQRADIYSLGLVLYRLTNHGREPFLDPTKQMIYYRDREAALRRRMDGEALPIPADASPKLAAVILRATLYEPDQRYGNAGEFRAALEQISQSDAQKQPEIQHTAAEAGHEKNQKPCTDMPQADKVSVGTNASCEKIEKPCTETTKEKRTKQKLLPLLAFAALLLVFAAVGINKRAGESGQVPETSASTEYSEQDTEKETESENGAKAAVQETEYDDFAEGSTEEETDAPGTVIVTAAELNIRETPDPDGAVLQKLSNGTICSTTGRKTADGSWLELELPDGTQTGWASAEYLVEVSASAEQTVRQQQLTAGTLYAEPVTCLNGKAEIALESYSKEQQTITIKVTNHTGEKVTADCLPQLVIDGEAIDLNPYANMSANWVDISAEAYQKITYYVDARVFTKGAVLNGRIWKNSPLADMDYSLTIKIQ